MYRATQNCSSGSFKEILVLEGVFAGAGIVLCSVAITLAFVLKLFRILIYRLAVYQVTSALVYGITCSLDVAQLLIILDSETQQFNRPLCLVTAFLTTYVPLVKLFFTLTMTIHLFIFSVCYKNLKRLELQYVLISLVLPGVMSVVPFLTGTYGQEAQGWPWCGIQQDDMKCPSKSILAGVVEVFALWYGPALISLLAISSLVVIMLCVLAHRVCKRSEVAMKNKTAIKQMLPLLVYPVTFSVLISLQMMHSLYDQLPGANGKPEYVFLVIDVVAFTAFTWTPGLALLVHILVMMCSGKRSNNPIPRSVAEDSSLLNTNRKSEVGVAKSYTYFSLPVEQY